MEESLPNCWHALHCGTGERSSGFYRGHLRHHCSVSLRIFENESRADEVLQEAYVNIWHNAAGYNAAAGTP